MNEQQKSLAYYVKWLKAQGATREDVLDVPDRTANIVDLLARFPPTPLFRNRNWQGAADPLPVVQIDIAAHLDAVVGLVFAVAPAVAVPVGRHLFNEYVQGECHSDEERNNLVSDVESFWGRMNSYMTPQRTRAYGLAVGRVQSGKTRNYIGLMFKAIDEGYNTIIVLTSKNSQLAVQTHRRVEKWFGNEGLAVANYRPLTSVRVDAGGNEVGVSWIGGQFIQNQVQVGIIIKNERGHLRNVREWMDQVGAASLGHMRLLFIDDESDSATPNTNNVADPSINSDEDVDRLVQWTRDSNVEGSIQIADWLEHVAANDNFPDADVESACRLLAAAMTRAGVMNLVHVNADFRRIVSLNEILQIDGQDHDLHQLVYDAFRGRVTRRNPLNWIVLRDFFNYVFEIRQERSRINRSICELVGHSADEPALLQYEKMVYAGYTATPFANMYNEDPTKDPLCPDCIKSLATSSKYFGLSRIFGGNGQNCNMNIVRSIEEDEYHGWVQPLQTTPQDIEVSDAELFVRAQNFAEEDEPEDFHVVEWTSIQQAVKWAFCTAAARRVMRLAGPHNQDDADLKYRWTTMLFNLSHLSDQDEGVHAKQQALMQRYVNYWLSPANREAFVDSCMEVWEEETAAFTDADFEAACVGYGDHQHYPVAEAVRTALRDWFVGHGGTVKVIQMNSAVDGGAQANYNDPTCQNGDVLWILCGGNAISRGLTLEGLTVSYYDRIKLSTAVDSITQQGRWFGYRPGYELLPRIWMTPSTVVELKQICRIEESLHEKINDLFEVEEDDANGNPHHPSIREGVDTASVLFFGRSLSGRVSNGVPFGNSSFAFFECVHENQAAAAFESTRNFCAGLGEAYPIPWENPDGRHARHRLFWRGVASATIEQYISTLREQYLSGPSVFEAEGLLHELRDYPGEWNVVVGNPDGQGLLAVDDDFFEGYSRRNNPIRREFGGVVVLGRRTFTGTALFARIPNKYIEAANAALPGVRIANIRHIDEVYRQLFNDPAADKALKRPIMLIDFVNVAEGEGAGRLFVQVSFYWYGHWAQSYFGAVIQPRRPNVIAPVAQFLAERGYASLTQLHRQFGEAFDGMARNDLRDILLEACTQLNPPLVRLDGNEALAVGLNDWIFCNPEWLNNARGDFVQAIGRDPVNNAELVGRDFIRKLTATHCLALLQNQVKQIFSRHRRAVADQLLPSGILAYGHNQETRENIWNQFVHQFRQFLQPNDFVTAEEYHECAAEDFYHRGMQRKEQGDIEGALKVLRDVRGHYRRNLQAKDIHSPWLPLALAEIAMIFHEGYQPNGMLPVMIENQKRDFMNNARMFRNGVDQYGTPENVARFKHINELIP